MAMVYLLGVTTPAIAPSVNLLTTNQWSLESGAATGYVNVSNTTLTSDTTHAYLGSRALKCAPASGADMEFSTLTGTSGVAVTPGHFYKVCARVYFNDIAIDLRASVRWYDSSGTLLSTDDGNYLGATQNVWESIVWVNPSTGRCWTAPSGAAYAAVFWRTSGIASFFLMQWLDTVGFYETGADTVTAAEFIAP